MHGYLPGYYLSPLGNCSCSAEKNKIMARFAGELFGDLWGWQRSSAGVGLRCVTVTGRRGSVGCEGWYCCRGREGGWFVGLFVVGVLAESALGVQSKSLLSLFRV